MRSVGLGPSGRYLALMLILLLLCALNESALARGRGGHSGRNHFGGSRAAVGVIVAAPVFWYLATPTVVPVVAPTAPPVYIEQGNAQPASAQGAGDWWYYCAQSRAYYPYVKECASEWQRVAPEPPTSR
jgi:hypothetical protein